MLRFLFNSLLSLLFSQLVNIHDSSLVNGFLFLQSHIHIFLLSDTERVKSIALKIFFLIEIHLFKSHVFYIHLNGLFNSLTLFALLLLSLLLIKHSVVFLPSFILISSHVSYIMHRIRLGLLLAFSIILSIHRLVDVGVSLLHIRKIKLILGAKCSCINLTIKPFAPIVSLLQNRSQLFKLLTVEFIFYKL